MNLQRLSNLISLQIICGLLSTILSGNMPFLLRCQPRGPQQRRKRVEFKTIESGLSDLIFRRIYRMNKISFQRLYTTLQPELDAVFFPKGGGERGMNSQYNICTKLRLSMAIRFFSGACPYDIMLVHGVSLTLVYASVWGVVNAINMKKELGYCFPNHEQQREIAAGFLKRSGAGFNKVVGAIDGLVICTLMPSLSECSAINCGQVRL